MPGSATEVEPRDAAETSPAEGEEGSRVGREGGGLNRLHTERRLGWYTRAKFAVVRGFFMGWLRLFGMTGLYWFGSVFATIEFLVNHRRRRRFQRALRRVFPEGVSRAREIRLTRRYFRRTRCDKLFYLMYDRLPRHKVMSRIRVYGRDHLDQGLSRDRGVYLAMSHHGSHHIMGVLLAALGYQVTGIRDRNEGALRSYMQQTVGPRVPEYSRCQVLYADDFPREIFRCFRERRLVISALDVNRARGSNLRTERVRIFGEARDFLVGPIQLAVRNKAMIVPAFLVSGPRFYYRIMIMPPLYAQDPAPETSALVQGYADAIAKHIRAYPDHLSRV